MWLYTSLTGVTALLFFLTSLFIYSRNPNSTLYQRSALFGSVVALWALGYFITLLDFHSYSLNLTISRLSHAAGAFIPVSYFHFVRTLLKKDTKKTFFRLSYILSSLMSFLSLTPLVIKALMPKMGILYFPEWGIFYPAYVLLFLIFLGSSHLEMLCAIRYLKGREKARFVCFFIGLALAFIGSASLFLLTFNVPVSPYLSVLIILYPPMMAYAILVHKFMEIEIFVKRTVVFTGIVVIAVGSTSFLFSSIQTLIGQAAGIPTHIMLLVGILTTVVVYRPLERVLIDTTDRLLFQKNSITTSCSKIAASKWRSFKVLMI